MTLSQALRAHLAANVPGVGGRVSPAPLPQGRTLPAITYQTISAEPLYAHDGDTLLDTERVQIDIWAASRSAADAVKAEVRNALSGFRGTMEGLRVGAAQRANTLDDYEPETKQYRVIMDFLIQYNAE